MSKTLSGATSRLQNHFVRSGVSHRDARRLASTIHLWMDRSGPEWTVNRLKEMKTFCLQQAAGNDVAVPPWIAHHKDGSFKGAFRVIHNLPLKSKLSVLNAYTSVVLKEPSMAQIKKTRESIEARPSNPGKVTSASQAALLEMSKSGFLRLVRENVEIRYSHLKPGGLTTANPGTLSGGDWVSSFIQGLNNPKVADFLDKKFGFDSSMTFDFEVPFDDFAAASPGAIHCIQERGAKARVVAMPNSALQSCLRPFHEGINRILKRLPTDCTHNQVRGAKFALQALNSGKSVYSVDLSSATDRFPRELQISLLKEIGLQDEAELIELASRGPWHLDPAFSPKNQVTYVRYGTGQPMGLYGSFALFALTHNGLLHGMCKRLGIKPSESFRVLGDDVVIANDDLHLAYRVALNDLEVPVSVSKTLASDRLAEFAGFVISKDYGNFKVPKIPTLDGRNFTSYIDAFGHAAIKDLPSRVRKVARLYAELPEDMGGLGLNPHGKSLEERILPFKFEDKSTSIIRYSSVVPLLIEHRARLRGFTEAEAVDFLYDQYRKSAELPSNLDRLRTLSNIAAPQVELQQQLETAEATLKGEHLGNVRTPAEMMWNIHRDPVSEVKPYQSDLDHWKRKFTVDEDDLSPS